MYAKKTNTKQRRILRTRTKLKSSANGRPRLSVHRSGQHIYAQVIDDEKGVTVAAASTIDKDLSAKIGKTINKEAAVAVGKLVAERAKKAGVSKVVFDRGHYMYHGRIKALAEAAREAGLSF